MRTRYHYQADAAAFDNSFFLFNTMFHGGRGNAFDF